MSAERQRQYRARKGARVGQSRGPAPSAPCGTVAAYKRHQRATEAPCEACRQAWAAWQRNYYQRRKVGPTGAGGHQSGQPI